MTTKLLITALCCISGTMAGLVFSNRLKTRAAFYKSLLSLIDVLISEVSFKKSAVKKVMEEFTAHNRSSLNLNLKEYIECNDLENLSVSKGLLSGAELYELQTFLRSLGRSDARTQIKELESAKKNFGTRSDDAEAAYKKLGSMYVKLGFFAGLTLGIVLL